jgi:hypothetical protein
VTEQVISFTGKTQPRRMAVPAKPAAVHLGSQALSYETSNLNYLDDKAAASQLAASRRPGGGLPLTNVPPFNCITGGGELTYYPMDHHGAARAHKNAPVPGAFPMLHRPPPKTNRADYDIISGGDRRGGGGGGSWIPYEHYGAKETGSGATGGVAGSTTSRHERVSGSRGGRGEGGGGESPGGPVSTRPW